jgi:hypothetical protein
MELAKKGTVPKLNNESELLKLVTQEFIKVMSNFGNALKLDIEKLETEQKEKSKEIISNFNRRLDFLENFKNDEELSEEMKKEIYNDFNNAATELGDYQISIYKDNQNEKIIKQVADGILKVVTVATLGSIVVALIKKIK